MYQVFLEQNILTIENFNKDYKLERAGKMLQPKKHLKNSMPEIVGDQDSFCDVD